MAQNKIKNLLLILSLIISIMSCNSKKVKPNDIKNIQEIFKIKGNVKEIETRIVGKDLYYLSKTTFDRDGNPVETIRYNKKGEVESHEPWTKLTEEELKQIKKEYDKDQKLIKQIEYNNEGKPIETEYKYSETGTKTEEIKKIGNRNIQTIYSSNGLIHEVITFVIESNKLYQQSKEKYIYNKKHYLTEIQTYRYPDENQIFAKHLYEYDKIGSLIKTTTYYNNEKTPDINNRKIIYY